MKNEKDKGYKAVYILNYFSSVCFYIISVISFINDNITNALIYMGLGSAFLCIGTLWLMKDVNNNKNQ